MNVLETTMMMAVGYLASAPCRVSLKELLQRVGGKESSDEDTDNS
jgi:hypothetical protein